MPVTIAQLSWLSVASVASLAGCSDRAVRLAIQRGNWRGSPLTLRCLHGRGGDGGKTYEVALASLPADLQAKWRALHPETVKLPATTGVTVIRDRRKVSGIDGAQQRAAIISEIMDSDDPTEAIKRKVGTIAFIDGRPMKLKRATLYRWLGLYSKQGIVTLQRKMRADAGRRRVFVSTAWDAALSPHLDEAGRALVASELRLHLEAMFAHGNDSVHRRAEWAQEALFKITRAQVGASSIDDDALLAACTVPRHTIEAERWFGDLAREYRTDAKAFSDRRRSRIARDRSGIDPMQIVVGDVHHLDICVRREDGSTAWPKAIAWYDLATNRALMHIYLPPKNEAVRQEHVVTSLIDLIVRQPDWGMPRSLLLDHGSEYRSLDYAHDLLSLADCIAQNRLGGTSDERRVRRARPYNPQGKPIEGFFATFIRLITDIPGYVGSNRLMKKSANLGKAPDPFPGTIEDLREDIAKRLHDYHHTPQRGHLEKLMGRPAAPFEVFEWFKREKGWQRLDADEADIEVKLSRPRLTPVRRGCLEIEKRRYSHPELDNLSGQRVTVLMPTWNKEPTWLRVILPDAKVLSVPQEIEVPYHDTDAPAARGKRWKVQAGAIRSRAEACEAVNVIDITERMRQRRPMPTPTSSIGIARLLPEDLEAAARLQPPPPPQLVPPPAAPPKPDIEERLALLDQFMPRQKDDGA